MSGRLTHELRRLSRLFTAAASSIEAIAEELDREQEAVPEEVTPAAESEVAFAAQPSRRDSAPPQGYATVDDALALLRISAAGLVQDDPVPWDALVDSAIELLRREPSRIWKPAELCRAARDSGIALASLQGVHFGLMPRLRQRGAVADAEGGFRASDLFAAGVRAPEPAAAPASAPPTERRELPWADIVDAAVKLLRNDPDRSWGQAELSRAVRDSGVPLDNLQGVHFGLTSRLTGLGVVELDDEGKLRLSALAGGQDSAPASAAAAQPPGVEEPRDEAGSLAEEIDACEIFLEHMTASARTAQVAVWAGRARGIQESWRAGAGVTAAQRDALRRVFGRLSRIAREHRCDWIDALTPGWAMNWTTYTAYYSAAAAGEEPALAGDEARAFWRGKLRGLLLPTRLHVDPEETAEVIERASAVLDADDDDLAAALARFGSARRAKPPLIRRRAPAATSPAPDPSPPAPASAPIAPALLAATRGKRALIVGGQGAREEHRETLQTAFGFSLLDWVFSERGASGHYARLEERVKHGSYDLVFFLAGYTSHKAVPFLRGCRAVRVPVVYLARGYSVAQFAHALEKQWIERAPIPPEGNSRPSIALS